ncbi:IQ calmodulin-binding motif-containing protein 1-like isoform X2 [Eleginops maclovinus]|uniref:IQ calmodulin-binding motif-containing protein 1-like isoform X2 n=1 Tax=Eleginops maclovinus TaxID=56733 RepID=UPI00307FD60C
MEEEVVLDLKRQLEGGDLNAEQRVRLLNNSLNKAVNMAALETDGGLVLTAVKSRLYLGGLLSHCIPLMTQYPRMQQGNWAAVARLAQLTSVCCVGVEPGEQSQAFHRLFLPSVMDGLLSLAAQLMRREQCVSLLRKVMDSVCWLLRAHPQLTTQVLSSEHYEQIQVCDDDSVTLLCVQMWIQTCTASRDFLSELSDDSALLLLNEAVGQLAVSSASSVGGASVRLILLMANQQEARVKPLLLSFRGLDSLLDKDWRGRGFEQEVDQLIAIIQSDARSLPQVCSERVRAACLIQAAWRSFQTRRRLRSLSRVVSQLQRRYRRRQLQQQEVQRGEEELSFQVFMRRLQARRKFHQKQSQLLQLLPPDQVQWYLQECERRAAVVIQSSWRGFRERRRYNTHRHTHTQQRAAKTLQRVVRLFLQNRRAAKAPPTTSLWIGQKGLTDSRRAELQRQVEEQLSLRPLGSCVSRQECEGLHQEVQLLLLQRRHQNAGGQRLETLLAHTHTQLEKLRDAPPLSVVMATVADSFLSPSGPIGARARVSHNALLQAGRLPWWRTLGDDTFSPAHLQGLEAELGGLFVGGAAGVKI